jgi:type I restriction enzyme S subunit
MTTLPHHWIQVRLSAFCSIKNGIAFSANDVVDKEELGAIACFRTSNIQEELDTSDVTYIPERLIRDRDYDLRVGDILMSTANSNTLVGKCCLIRAIDQESIFGGFISRIRVESDLLDPEYAYLWLSSGAVQSHLRQRARQTTNIANLPPGDVLSTLIVIPPLSEQRRIVEILNEARDIRRLRQQADDLTTQIIPAIFNEMFGDLLQGALRTTLGEISSEVRYGTSSASADSGFATLRIPNVVGDTISYNDLVTVPLEPQEAARYALQEGDLLFVRTNGNPDYIGRCGVFDPSIAQNANLNPSDVIFASYLIRVRLKVGTLNPYFVAAYLRTPHGRADILRQAKTSAGQFNINTQGLKGLSIPIFSADAQAEFLKIVFQVDALKRSLYSKSDIILNQVTSSLLAHAFSGELTADWRTQNREQLAQEAAERDQWLRDNGVKLSISDQRIHDRLDQDDLRLAELNREQRKLLEEIQNLDPNENGGTFTLSSLVSKLGEPLDCLPVDAVRRHLDVLAARGLIKAISRRAGAGGSVNVAFGNLYRQPLKDDQIVGTADEPDFQKMSELDRLSRQRQPTFTGSGSITLPGVQMKASGTVNNSEGDD